MVNTRVIPCLLLHERSLVKTVKFKNYHYIGDPINTCRIFNELEVDELLFLDISASKKSSEPNYNLLQEITNECFMPLAYGGGIKTIEQAERIFKIGFEKIVINSAAFLNRNLIKNISKRFGSQSVIAAIDVKKNLWRKYEVYSFSGTVNNRIDPISWAKRLEEQGVGEIILTNISHEGTWNGFDIEITKKISNSVSVPVIAHGGAGKVEHLFEVVKTANASAVAIGSMVVYQQRDMGVLINFPEKCVLDNIC